MDKEVVSHAHRIAASEVVGDGSTKSPKTATTVVDSMLTTSLNKNEMLSNNNNSSNSNLHSPPASAPPPDPMAYYKRRMGKWFGASVALLYGTLSMSAIVMNKYIMNTWEFHYPLVMIASQMAISYVLLVVFSAAGIVNCPKWSLETAKKVWPLSLTHVANVLLGLIALALVDIPMFSALRRCGIVFVVFLEFFILKKLSSKPILASITVMSVGALIAGWADLRFDPLGYALTFCCNLVTALALVLIPKIASSSDLGPIGLMLYQITLGFPLIFMAAIYRNEVAAVMEYPYWSDTSFQVAYFFSCAQVFVLNYSIFLCTFVNSPLTTTVTGQLKDIGTTLVGFIFFKVPTVPMNVFGITLGLAGSVAYSLIKNLEQQQGQPRSADAPNAKAT